MNDDTQVDVQMVINDLLDQLKQAQLQLAILRAQLNSQKGSTPVEND